MEKTNDVIGIGSALMDFLIEVDDKHLIEMNLNKGEMHLVEEEKAKELLEKVHNPEMRIETIPGGSAANTLKGIALLGGNVTLIGTVGKDQHGEVYVEEIKKHGVSLKMKNHDKTTGHCISFITPDSERTMSTHLGAAIHIEKEDILEEDIAKSKILYLEGYQLEGSTREVVLHAIQFAKKHGTLVSLDLADPGVIRRNKEFFQELLQKIDIVFVNESEAKEITGLEEEEALRELAKYCDMAIVKLGEKGSMIQHNDRVIKVEPFSVSAVDTTGAGDSYAAGLLYGYCNDWDLKRAGMLGSLLASKVVSQRGVGMKDIIGEELKKEILA